MSKKMRICLIIIGLLLIAAGLILLYFYFFPAKIPVQNTNLPAAPTSEVKDSKPKIDNPIDFAALKKQNEEIYAYIQIDGTKVDYPIVQSLVSDDFYLTHRAEDKAYSASGAIYTQSLNHTDFSDPVTLIYGHNGYWDTMFTTLHKFEDKTFFEEHPYFVIWQKNRKLTYQIISAFKYDDRHILNSFNLSDTKVLAEFQKMVQNPTSMLKNVRSPSSELNADSKLVILSTCITGQKENRYLVCGVLISDETTE